MQILGSCHCGNISFTLDWDPTPGAIPGRSCSCTFCTRHGAVWTANPSGKLRVYIQDKPAHTTYSFETRTADFHICTRCGVVPVVTSLIEGRLYAVVNVNTFVEFDRTLLNYGQVSFDNEADTIRLKRRARSWISQVEFAEAIVLPA